MNCVGAKAIRNIPSHVFHIPHVRHLNPDSMQDICPMNLVLMALAPTSLL